MDIPNLTPAQSLALKRLFSGHHGGTTGRSKMGGSSTWINAVVARRLESLGLCANKTRKVRGSERRVYDGSRLTWKGGHVAWELCGRPSLDAYPKWDHDTLTWVEPYEW